MHLRKFCLSVLLFALVLSRNGEAAAFTTVARFAGGAGNPGWYGPLSQWWNILTDYEGSGWTMGVSDYTFSGSTTYRGCTTMVNKHYWRDSNDGVYHTTTYTDCSGQGTTDVIPFSFYEERRDYSCETTYGSPPSQMSNTTDVNTKHWVRHTIGHWPVSGFHVSPGTGSVTVKWVYTSLTSGCTGGEQTGSGLGATSTAAYQRDTIKLHTATIPVANADITARDAGKNL